MIKTVDSEGYPALGEEVTGVMRFLAVPDGYGGILLKHEQDVTDADHEAIKTYREEEASFYEATCEKAAGEVAAVNSPTPT